MQAKETMRKIELQEYETSNARTLSVDERDALARKELNLSIAPVAGTTSQYTLKPGSIVGAVETGGMSVRIAPKIGIRQLLSLACYGIDKVKPQEREFDFWEHAALPDVRFDRLNEHYRSVATLARLILRHGAFESTRGEVRASGFLMDMNKVFQEFVTVALRDALGVSEPMFGEHRIRSLDDEGHLSLQPDLVWRDGSFVGDVKYKRADGGVPNADLYQLLAYTTALDLPGGLLIYAQGEHEPMEHTVRHSGKRLEVATLDLSGTLEETLARIAELAQRIRRLRRSAIRQAGVSDASHGRAQGAYSAKAVSTAKASLSLA